MWEELFVLFQRILAGTIIASVALTGVVWIVSGRTKRKTIKKEKIRNRNIEELKSLENQKETENQVQQQTEIVEVENSNIIEDEVIQKMQQDSINAGLTRYKFGNLIAECSDDKWLNFVKQQSNNGGLDESKETVNLDNTVVYNQKDQAVFRIQGKGEEINPLIAKNAPLEVGNKVIEYYKNLNTTNRYTVKEKADTVNKTNQAQETERI